MLFENSENVIDETSSHLHIVLQFPDLLEPGIVYLVKKVGQNVLLILLPV